MNFLKKKIFKIYFSYKTLKKNGKNFLQKKIKKITFLNVLRFFPFIFSFLEIINFKFQNKKLVFLFRNNFSIKKKLEEKVSWETFDLFKIKDFSFPEEKQNIIQYNVYNDYFLIEVSKKNFLSSIGLIKKDFFFESNNRKIFKNSRFLIFSDKLFFFSDLKKNLLYTKFLNFVFFEKLIYEVDILPLKINEVDFLPQKKNNFFYIKNKKIKNLLVKKNDKFNFLLFDEKTKKLDLFNEQKNFSLKGVKEKKYFYPISKEKKISFFDEKKNLQKKINFFFFKNKFFRFENKTEFFDFSKNNFLSIPKIEIIEILDNFLKKKIIEYISPRLVSGYNFTDLQKNEKSFIFLYYFSKNKQYKLTFPFDFLFLFNNTRFLTTENFYCLNLNKKKNNFNGFNIIVPSEKIIEDSLEKNTFNIKNFQTFSFKKTKKKIYKKYKKINDFFVKNFLVTLELKKKRNIIFLDEKKIILKKNSFFNFFVQEKNTEKIITKNQPFSEKLFDKNYKIKKYYFLNKENYTPLTKKIKKNSFYFSQNWESFSCSSWLFITQFVVSFFLLKIIKDVYQDYGKELIQFLIEFGNSAEIDLDALKEQYFIENSEYKIIRKTKKQFKDIVGIDFLLPESGEILWLLKNSGRSARYKKSIPKGILLTGPPGTGKTLLVQAIAGEAKVPVIVQSASLLIDPKEKGRSVKKLKKVFQKARSFSPCIIFIDEIDSLGGKRQKLYQLGNNSDKIFEIIYEKKNIEKKFFDFNFLKKQNSFQSTLFSNEKINEENFSVDFSKNLEEEKTKLHLLTQFLIEMDGLKNRKGVFVFGATNRVESLDPALIRPGRFDKLIPLPTPSKKKRIQILKFYSKKRKIEKKISWNYIANRMIQCSAADIAAIMNESAIQSIIQETTHTVETIEKGINYITSYSVLKNKKNNLLQNKAYYQSGKALSYSLFSKQKEEKGFSLSLWDRKKNTRYKNNFNSYFFENQSRKTLEFFLISSHFGKVGELIFLFGKKKKKSKFFESDYGHEDRALLSILADFLIENWFFYSTKIFLRQENQTLANFSIIEKTQYNIFLAKLFENEMVLQKKNEITTFYQKRNFSAWWEQEISKRVSENEAFFSDWYRLFLPDPEESLLNLEWIPPDLIIHNNEILKKLGKKSNINYNSLYKIERDFIFQSLILNTFDFAFSKEENLRQFLDFFSDQLIRYGVVRDFEISKIYKIK